MSRGVVPATIPASSRDHLVDLADGWLLWKTICLRGAGLPVHWLERLAAPEAVAEIDRLLELEAVWDAAREAAIKACHAAGEGMAPEARKACRRATKILRKGPRAGCAARLGRDRDSLRRHG